MVMYQSIKIMRQTTILQGLNEKYKVYIERLKEYKKRYKRLNYSKSLIFLANNSIRYICSCTVKSYITVWNDSSTFFVSIIILSHLKYICQSGILFHISYFYCYLIVFYFKFHINTSFLSQYNGFCCCVCLRRLIFEIIYLSH